ncbi:MAG: hypothetical protein RLZZ393_735, partial [Pseudomonadota bacterium]
MMRKTFTVFMMASLLALGACSGKKVKPDAGRSQTVGTTAAAGAQSSGTGNDSATTRVTVGGGTGGGGLGPTGALGSQRIV